MKETSHGILGLVWVQDPYQVAQIAASVSSEEPKMTLKPLFHFGSLKKNMKHINYIIRHPISVFSSGPDWGL